MLLHVALRPVALHPSTAPAAAPPTAAVPHAGLAGLSRGTLHVVLTGEGEAALVMTEEAHQLLRQQNVDAYAPSGG